MNEHIRPLLYRLERVERANRRMRLIGGALLAMLIAAGAATGPTTLKARSFQVVDANGHVLATLGAANGNGSLNLNDSTGVLRQALGTSADLVSTGFSTYGTNGVQRTSEGIDENNTGGFVDHDVSGNIRAFLGHFTFQNQSGAFAFDQTGAALAGVNVNPDVGFSGFIDNIRNTGTAFYNNRITLGTFDSVTNPDTEDLYFFDANGTARGGMGADNPCCGLGNELLFFNNSSNTLVGDFFAPNGGGGSYNTFDQNGNPTGSLP